MLVRRGLYYRNWEVPVVIHAVGSAMYETSQAIVINVFGKTSVKHRHVSSENGTCVPVFSWKRLTEMVAKWKKCVFGAKKIERVGKKRKMTCRS